MSLKGVMAIFPQNDIVLDTLYVDTYRCPIRLLNSSAGMTSSCSVEGGESRSLSLHVVPGYSGLGDGWPAETSSQHHLLAILYST